MSLFKYGNFETEVDFTNADFLDVLDEAYVKIQNEAKNLPVVGKVSNIVRAQNACYDRFLNRIFGEGTSEKMFNTSSLAQRIDAVELLAVMRKKEEETFNRRLDGYQVNKPVNREQRRESQKNHNRNRR